MCNDAAAEEQRRSWQDLRQWAGQGVGCSLDQVFTPWEPCFQEAQEEWMAATLELVSGMNNFLMLLSYPHPFIKVSSPLSVKCRKGCQDQKRTRETFLYQAIHVTDNIEI